jgi:transcriptional regulator with AAA-type ATPase domain
VGEIARRRSAGLIDSAIVGGFVQANWIRFVREMTDASSFERAADLALGSVLEACGAVLSTQPSGRARALRANVHVRHDESYERVAGRSVDASVDAGSYAPSATAWRWVAQTKQPVALDVTLGLVEAHDGASFRTVHETKGEGISIWETQKGILGRGATHILVLPLRGSGGAVFGMIAVEADARAAIGLPLWGDDVVTFAQAVADVAAPHLLHLPSAASEEPPVDPRLPVVGRSMRPLVEMLRVFARQEETILLSGPTGAGKSKLARWCHDVSPRSKGPFEVLELASVSEDLQMAELFGWKKGAFTGAVRDNAGHVARAEGGTLFIDEVDKLSVKAQAGLLRVLEERRYRSLGDGAGERPADVRFIVGTNVALQALVRSGAFREDLYYRIHVLPVRVPPLAEREDEIVPWAVFMLDRRHGGKANGQTGLAPEAVALLRSYRWPGNLRQLDNIIRRAYALVLLEHPAPPARILLEQRHVERALAYEGHAEHRSLVELLHAVATQFVLEAERRPPGAPLDLDLTEALRGLVLAVAAQKLGGPDAAFRLFGKDSLVQHRNHMKVLRKELARVEKLYAELGGGPMPFANLPEDA